MSKSTLTAIIQDFQTGLGLSELLFKHHTNLNNIRTMAESLDKTSSLYRQVQNLLASARNNVTGYAQPRIVTVPSGTPPVADFNIGLVSDHGEDETTQQLDGTLPLVDLSTNNPTSWIWKMSVDGGSYMTFSTLQNPVIDFGTLAGSFSPPISEFSGGEIIGLSLTAINAYGSSTKLVSPAFNMEDGMIDE